MIKITFISTAITVFIISALVHLQLLNIALFGDDWLVFWRYLKILGPYSSGEWNHFNYLFTLYGPMDILFGLLEKIFGYNAIFYHITAFTFRYIAALSIYLLTSYLVKNKTAAFFSALFFSITPIGFDTTNWVFNMTAYLSIASLNIFLYLFLKSRTEYKLLIPSGLFYFLANILAPIRMTGTLPIILLIELYNLLRNFNAKQLKYSLLRIIFVIGIFFIVIKLGSFGTSSGWMENINAGISFFTTEFEKGRTDIFFYLPISIGSMLIPDVLLSNIQISRKLQIITDAILPVFTIFSILVIFIEKYIYNSNKNVVSLFFAGILWSLIVFFIHTQNIITFSGSENIILLLSFGYLFIFAIAIFLRNLNTDTSLAIFISVNLILLTFFIAWWRSPITIFETTHRYLIVAASGISLLLATILGTLLNQRKTVFPIALMILLILIHALSTKIYITHLHNLHNQQATDKIWGSFPKIPEISQDPGPFIFFFSSDNESASILHNVVTFGLPPHMALIYNTSEMTTIGMDEWKELVSAVSDGKSLKKYGFIETPVPIEKIYAFHLRNKTILENKTDEVRAKLKSTSI